MKKIVILLCGFFIIGAVNAASLPIPQNTPLVPLDKVVVVVNDSVITQQQISAAVIEAKQQLQRSNTPVPALRALQRQVINNLIYTTLQKQMIKRAGIKVSSRDLNQAVISIAKRNGMSLEQLKGALEQHGQNYAQYRKKIAQQIAMARLQQQEVGSQVNVADEEISDYVNKMKNTRGANSAYRIEDILIPVSSTPTPLELHKAKLQAQKVLAQIKQGKNFRTLAAAQSGGQQALQGGDLGWRKLAELPSIFSGKVKAMRIGQVLGPIQAPNGYHIIKLVNVRYSGKKLTSANVKGLIYRRKFEEQLQMWLKKIRNQAYVKFV